EPGREGPAASALQGGEAGAGGDPVQPRAQRRPAFEGVVRAPGPDVGLLDLVLGVVHGAEHAGAVRQQLTPVRSRLAQEVFLDGAVRAHGAPSSRRATGGRPQVLPLVYGTPLTERP